MKKHSWLAFLPEELLLRTVCRHPRAAPAFDEVAAEGLGADEVRRRWPRGTRCPDCGTRGAFYASLAHYYAGDW